jgi:hypothetical protein
MIAQQTCELHVPSSCEVHTPAPHPGHPPHPAAPVRPQPWLPALQRAAHQADQPAPDDASKTGRKNRKEA